MRTFVLITIAGLLIASCNTRQGTQVVPVSTRDSLVLQVEHRDSGIMAYIRSINSIQKGIDTLMIDEKVLKIHSEKIHQIDTATIITELRTIGRLIIKNQQELNMAQRRLAVSNEKNQDLADLGENLSRQLNEKDSEIAATQQLLIKTRASLASVVEQLNDSVNVIVQQRSQIGILTLKGNTVYYVIGKEKDLEKDGIIMKNGGVVGLGKVPVLDANSSNSGFMSGDLTQLHEIALGGRFVRFVTPHPVNSYKIISSIGDKLLITDPEDFWSKSKYMVVIID